MILTRTFDTHSRGTGRRCTTRRERELLAVYLELKKYRESSDII